MPALVSPDATGAASNATTLHVICEFPLSGQYGLGSRLLYYALVVACVVWQSSRVIKKACLAAALIFPAVAAIHGIVLAALHRDDVVDMDIFGAFQLCAIGILAAPVTVKLSSTYFFDPRRNLIFAWTILILAGLLSLTVEFFRSSTSPCPYDDSGQPLSPDPLLFNYNDPPTCNLTCNITSGPFSPIRQGSANNIYVVPAPERVTFGTGTLLGAACCIPAILHLISMWNKIRWVNWNAVFGAREKKALIDGTDGATVSIKKFPIIPEVLVFGAAVLFVLVLGEMNFFSSQVTWQTEPMSAIGQWASILGTMLAVVGFLYHMKYGKNKSLALPHNFATGGAIIERHSLLNDGGRTSIEGVISPPRPVTPTSGKSPPERAPTMKPLRRVMTLGDVGKQKLARALTSFSERLAPTPDQYGDSEYTSGPASGYPEILAERARNPKFNDIENRYTGKVRQHSRTPSFTFEGNTPSRGQSPRRSHSGTSPAEGSSGELQNVTHPSAGSNGEMLQRQPTLTVPALGPQGRMLSLSASPITSDDSINQGLSSPAVVIFHDPQELDPDVS